MTIMVSPFWDARRGRGFPPEQVEKGFDEIAATRAGGADGHRDPGRARGRQGPRARA
ncbi:hypothetical protein ACFSTC_47340 [Nonomuraea ferruginea]